ncbi:MAG: hypothetical protein AB1749_00060 [Pseudomonadota bacterium]
MNGRIKSAAIAAGVAMLALTGAVGGAEAGGKHLRFGVHKHHFLHAPLVIHDGCGYYKRMWWKTGFLFWKEKYFICKGWW